MHVLHSSFAEKLRWQVYDLVDNSVGAYALWATL